MKFLPLLVIGLLLSAISCAQPAIPSVVKEAFKSKYPSAQSAKWEADDADYEVEFSLEGKKMGASFNASGNWLETETAIKKSALPIVVQQAISSGFVGFSVIEVEQISSPEWDNAYEVELKKGKETIEVVFSDSGQVLRKESDDEEEDDDEGNN